MQKFRDKVALTQALAMQELENRKNGVEGEYFYNDPNEIEEEEEIEEAEEDEQQDL